MARLTSASTWTTWMVLTLGSGCGGPANDPGAPAASGGLGSSGGARTSTTGAAPTPVVIAIRAELNKPGS